MPGNLSATAKKLIKALNMRNYQLTFSTKQFMGREGAPHNYYIISKAEWCEEKNRYNHSDIYSSTSMVRIVLYLRDMWYLENGWELPTDQELWNDVRAELQAKGDLVQNG